MPSTPRTRKRQQQARRAKKTEDAKAKLRRNNTAARKQARLKLDSDRRRDNRRKDREARRKAKLELTEEEEEQLQERLRRRAYRKELEEDWYPDEDKIFKQIREERQATEMWCAVLNSMDRRTDEEKARDAAAFAAEREAGARGMEGGAQEGGGDARALQRSGLRLLLVESGLQAAQDLL